MRKLQDMAGEAINTATGGQAGNLMSMLTQGPLEAIKQAFGGIFKGMLWVGLPLLLFPDMVRKVAGSIGKGKELAAFEKNEDGSDNKLNTVLAALATGAFAGAGYGAVKGGVGGATGNEGIGDLVAKGAFAIVAASVAMGVTIKDGHITMGDAHSGSAPVTPAKAAEPRVVH